MKLKWKLLIPTLFCVCCCMQTKVFAAPQDFTFSGTGEAGYNLTVETGEKPIAAQVVKQTDTNYTFSAYCIDYTTDLAPNAAYTSTPLEDCALFSTEKAKRVRAILRQSHPFISVAEVKRLSGIEVTKAEAVTATQIAVWKLTNNFNAVVAPPNNTNTKVTSLRDYYLGLVGLDPTPPVTKAAIEATSSKTGTVLDIAYRATQTHADGKAIRLKVSAVPSVTMRQMPTDAQGYSHMQVDNPPASLSVTIKGTQEVEKDVFGYKPVGTSQYMAGVRQEEFEAVKTLSIGQTGGIRLQKLDSATLKGIANVTFLLSQSAVFDQPCYSIVTDAQGIATYSGLAAGTWYLREQAGSADYMPLTQDITVSVGSGVRDVVVKNTPYSKIKLIKVNQENYRLAGAKFSIYAGSTATGTPLYTDLTTDSQGVILQGGLTAGEYTIVETAAPPNYQKDPTPVTVTLFVGETKTVTFTNTAVQKAVLQLYKYDAQSNEQLAGAVFTVYADQACTQVVATAVSLATQPAVIDTLAPGQYTIKETTPPAGYLPNDTKKVVKLEWGKTVGVSFENTKDVPTAGNYATLLLSGGLLLVLTSLGWVGYVYEQKRKAAKGK